MDLLRIPVFALSMCTSVTAFAAQTLAFITLPFLLLEGQGRGHFEAGLLITAWPLAIVLVAPLAGRLIPRFPGGLLGGIGLALMSTGLAGLALMPESVELARGLAARAVRCGLRPVPVAQQPHHRHQRPTAPAGAASGMLGTARLTGQSLGAVLLGLIFSVAGVGAGGYGLAGRRGAGRRIGGVQPAAPSGLRISGAGTAWRRTAPRAPGRR